MLLELCFIKTSTRDKDFIIIIKPFYIITCIYFNSLLKEIKDNFCCMNYVSYNFTLVLLIMLILYCIYHKETLISVMTFSLILCQNFIT